MKIYTLLVTIKEGSDEFWEDLEKEGKSGCDEILQAVRNALSDHGFQEGYGTTVKLEKFENND